MNDDFLYRPCVGIVLFNNYKKVFVAKRFDSRLFGFSHAWQFPQGGIEQNEEPATAALRELFEETGVSGVEIISEMPNWLYYDLPENIAKKIWHGKYKGQKQKWFLMKFLGDDSQINLAQNNAEFCDFEWINAEDAIERVVPFKQDVYKEVVEYFQGWLR